MFSSHIQPQENISVEGHAPLHKGQTNWKAAAISYSLIHFSDALKWI